jgi:predicted RNA-binding Zn ribbon-like protein
VAPHANMIDRIASVTASPVTQLARQLIEELTLLDPTRLRRCAKEECDLLFYDNSRSRTQRWHAEDPCGWRERQRSRRAHVRATPR